jgi:replication-associated recombination protein RarA
MSTNPFDADTMPQAGFAFPEPLTERYGPQRVADFLVDKPKRVMLSLIANPRPSAWFFLGPSGTGKTTMALAVAQKCQPRFIMSRKKIAILRPFVKSSRLATTCRECSTRGSLARCTW